MPQTSTTSTAGARERDELESSDVADDDADYDEIILKDLDDSLLRRIFCSLCGEE